MYLVVWTEKHPASGTGLIGFTDHWSTHETREEADAVYDEVKGWHYCYSASLCAPLESTDYDNPLEHGS